MLKKVDWKRFAEEHGMNKQQFADEIINTMISLGSIYMDHHKSTMMTVEQGDYMMTIQKIKDEE
jgi:flagellar biosynthesis regulator FlaF